MSQRELRPRAESIPRPATQTKKLSKKATGEPESGSLSHEEADPTSKHGEEVLETKKQVKSFMEKPAGDSSSSDSSSSSDESDHQPHKKCSKHRHRCDTDSDSDSDYDIPLKYQEVKISSLKS